MRSPWSDIAITPVDDGLVVSGEIDAHTAPELRQALLERVREFGSTWLDARGVTFMDSSGLRVLVEAANASKEHGGDMVVLSPPERILRRIQLGGLAGYLSIVA